ncbi:unnamed protein product [Trypanosoma congolense IL3000]|uniref:DUF3456 domain-containing protein n=1 Tax=Trypanosoma congolense (strain IL3000) TaxID=1068625 RepID=F9WJ43_TRYCI|nr:conserved hypothetical protein [Trypanosoma congolense IL3000]CCD17346.1 unnamed protein product [Trypanosoma congolense IL3000]
MLGMLSLLLLLLAAKSNRAASNEPIDFSKMRNPLDMDEINEKLRKKVDDDDPVQKSLPDPTDPKFRLPLKCSACGAVIEHVVRLLRPIIEQQSLRAARSGGKVPSDALPKSYEVVDVFENLCGEIARFYGLEVEEEKQKLTLRFSKSFGIKRLQGSWIPSFLTSTCEDLLNSYEEEQLTAMVLGVAKAEADAGRGRVISMNPDQGIVDQVREMVCTNWKESSTGCDHKGLAIDPRTEEDDNSEMNDMDL